jgi:uncharacterized metal-binding protein YceD (DUF177 family)
MKLLNKFDIVIAKLELGRHEFSFIIDDEFFELFEYSLVDHGDLKVQVDLDRKASFISLGFSFAGVVELVCDRSLDKFDHKLESTNKVIIKFGEEAQELTDEIEVIPFSTQQINIARYIYEFISVAIPMKKLHPRYQDEADEDQIIYSSKNDDEEEHSEPDPRWSELKKLKNK